MPEGPEVRHIVDALSERLTEKCLLKIDLLSGRYTRHGPPEGSFDLIKNLPRMITSVECHGKFIYFKLDEGWSIWSTLGMSGTWQSGATKHSRVKLTIEDDEIFFNDMRNFGTLRFVKGHDYLCRKLTKLGPDMLSQDITDFEFKNALRKRKNKTIVQAVMDQSVIAGVGNYLKAESLYMARISPHRLCSSLSDREISALNKSIKSTIRESYRTGGATISTYQDFDGNSGKYTRRFAVYNQDVDPIGNQVIKERTSDGRTTHWVPEVQN